MLQEETKLVSSRAKTAQNRERLEWGALQSLFEERKFQYPKDETMYEPTISFPPKKKVCWFFVNKTAGLT